jgi:hypothetical protein
MGDGFDLDCPIPAYVGGVHSDKKGDEELNRRLRGFGYFS